MSDELRAVLREEVAESGDHLARHLEALYRPGGDLQDHLASAFRYAHNLKGAARIAGSTTIVAVAHAMEDTLGDARSRGEAPPAALVELMIEGVSLMERLASGDRDVEARLPKWAVAIAQSRVGPGEGPPVEAPEPEAPAADEPEEHEAAQASSDAAPGAEEATVRVAAGRLDGLVNQLIGLQISSDLLHLRLEGLREHVQRISETVHRGIGPEGEASLTELVRGLEVALDRAEVDRRDHRRTMVAARDAAHRLRMVPLASKLGWWRRAVREAAAAAGKRVELHAIVGDVEVDRVVAERLQEPVMHLLSNAVAHGIESREDRVAAGKPEAGRIELRAHPEGRWIVVDVTDDGRGVDLEAVADSAASRGIVPREELDGMNAAARRELLFLPGVSTADRVTPLAGRGVGLDAVRDRARALGGECELLEADSGHGAHFRFRVPAAVLARRVLLVRAGASVVALPVEDVERVDRVDAGEVQMAESGAAVALQDGRTVELVSLSSLMGLDGTSATASLWIVVMTGGHPRRALVVDEIMSEMEVVARPLPWNVPELPGIAALAALPDGCVAAMLDRRAWLAGRSSIAAERSEAPRPAAAPSSRRLLVADDSLTSRTLVGSILRGAGFEVVLAVDGDEAWQALRESGPFDLVVSDIEMPGLTGLELTRRIRSHSTLRSLPVILVTNLGSEDDRAAGAMAGADEYIVKGALDTRSLLAAVERYL